jgi:hypothetical protein
VTSHLDGQLTKYGGEPLHLRCRREKVNVALTHDNKGRAIPDNKKDDVEHLNSMQGIRRSKQIFD